MRLHEKLNGLLKDSFEACTQLASLSLNPSITPAIK
jgi:hypothetical protein